MKKIFILLVTVLSFNAYPMIDAQLLTKPDKAFMSFFLESYQKWHAKNFYMRPEIDSREGNSFLTAAIKEIDHWRTPEYKELDQFLIGQSFNEKSEPSYTFRIYVAGSMRGHPYLKALKLPFPVMFVEKNAEDGICFIGALDVKDITWQSVPRYEKNYYLQHYCKSKLKYISYLSYNEAAKFTNPFVGQADYEVQTYSIDKLERVFQYVKTTHTALLLPQHIPYINTHGVSALVPFDKFAIDSKNNMTIYYP